MTRGWGARVDAAIGPSSSPPTARGFARREARGTASRRAGTGVTARAMADAARGLWRARAGEVWASGTARVARDLQRPRWRQATSTSQPVDSIKRNPIGARRSFTSSMNLRPPSVIAPREIVAPAQFVQRTTLGVATRARRASSGRDGERGVHADGGGRDAAEHGQRGAFARAARPLRARRRASRPRAAVPAAPPTGVVESARPPPSPPPPSVPDPSEPPPFSASPFPPSPRASSVSVRQVAVRFARGDDAEPDADDGPSPDRRARGEHRRAPRPCVPRPPARGQAHDRASPEALPPLLPRRQGQGVRHRQAARERRRLRARPRGDHPGIARRGALRPRPRVSRIYRRAPPRAERRRPSATDAPRGRRARRPERCRRRLEPWVASRQRGDADQRHRAAG